MNLEEAGWGPDLAAAFAPLAADGLQPARVALELNHIYRLWTEGGEVLAEAAGKLRHEAAGRHELPAVGDWVAFRPDPHDPSALLRVKSRGRIEAILPRRSVFTRKVAGHETKQQVVAANIDTVFLVTSLDRDFNPRRVERYLLLAAHSGARPIVILNKSDLPDASVDAALEAVRAIAPGIATHALSARTQSGLDALMPYLAPGQTVALLGSSGVGKSSIINALAGDDVLKTRSVRQSDSRGRHTSTHRQMVRLPGGALLIDTPGMRELQLWDVGETFNQTFEDIDALGDGCRFRDCRHAHEPGCAVKAGVAAGTLAPDRYQSFIKLQAEREAFEARQDERALIDEKRRGKIGAKALRARLKEKR